MKLVKNIVAFICLFKKHFISNIFQQRLKCHFKLN